MRILFLLVFCLLSSITVFSDESIDRIFIIEAEETGKRDIQELWYIDEWGNRYYKQLEIPYNLSLSDGSRVELIATWANNWFADGGPLFVNWSALTAMRETFYLEVGDEIVFLKPSKGFATKMGAELFYFKIFRDGVLVDTYQGWLRISGDWS